MGKYEWGMGNGEWGMGNGEWGMGNGCYDTTSLFYPIPLYGMLNYQRESF